MLSIYSARCFVLFLALALVMEVKGKEGVIDEVLITIYPSKSSAFINPRFASYSYEYGGLPSVAGTSPNLRPSFFQLMDNIKLYTGASPQFRIGGNSADTSWWNPNNLPKPPKITYNIEPAEIQTIQDVTSKLDTHATLSVNFDNANDSTWAVDYMKAVQSQIGWDNIYGIEIGNEVDLFGSNGFRPPGYNYSTYDKEFEYYVKSISPYIPNKFIQGATFCCLDSFFESIPAYIKTEQGLLKTVSVHNYPTTHCNNHTVELSELLSDSASEGVAAFFKPYAEAANAAGIEFWIGEMNSASCGGAPNVSDVFGAALWATDILFNYANIGVRGVNFHGGSGGYYTSFAYNSTESQIPEVRPIYYAQYLFAQAILSNSSIIKTMNVSTTNNLIKAWAVYNPDGDVRIVIIHKDITTKESANVTIRFTAGVFSHAYLLPLTAPSPYSKTGIKIAVMQTFDGTTTGAPVGTAIYPELQGSADKMEYYLTVPPASIAMVHATAGMSKDKK